MGGLPGTGQADFWPAWSKAGRLRGLPGTGQARQAGLPVACLACRPAGGTTAGRERLA